MEAMNSKRVWRPRVTWQRKPFTVAIPDKREPTRQELRQAARDWEGDGPECPQCGGPTVEVGACYRCTLCGFKSACGQD